jgi:hypothetical protein
MSEHDGTGEGRNEEWRPGDARPPMDRLPPPAFPPGHRRDRIHRPRSTGSAGGGAFPAEAFFSPDDPIRRPPDEGGKGEGDAWPGPPRAPRVRRRIDAEHPSFPAPTAPEIADLLEELAHEIRSLGTGRFHWRAGAPPLEAALRGVLSGYLRQGRG